MKFTVSGISAEIKKIRSEFQSQAQKNLTKQTEAFVKDVAQATPIDTGKARHGWVAEKTREGYEVKNEVPYIEFLNQGTSKQAPAHFVEATAMKYGTPLGAIVESVK